MNIEIKKYAEKIYIAIFDCQYDLTMTFVRIQEFYESPVFKGKYFSLEEFMDYWSKEMGDGKFTYIHQWSGFNVPGNILRDWRELYCVNSFEPIRDKEFALLDKLFDKLRQDKEDLKSIYLFGFSKDNKNIEKVINHESAHAMYHVNERYKESVDKLIRNYDSGLVKTASKKIKEMGYGENVINDEIQAYWSTNISSDGDLGYKNEFKENYLKFKGLNEDN